MENFYYWGFRQTLKKVWVSHSGHPSRRAGIQVRGRSGCQIPVWHDRRGSRNGMITPTRGESLSNDEFGMTEEGIVLKENYRYYSFAMAMKRTYQPKKKKRVRTHGFRKRMQKPGGRNVLRRRRLKGRKKLAL